jgi:hypothetical protein
MADLSLFLNLFMVGFTLTYVTRRGVKIMVSATQAGAPKVDHRVVPYLNTSP